MPRSSFLTVVGVAGVVLASAAMFGVAGWRAWRAAYQPLVSDCGCGQTIITPARQDLWPAGLLFMVASSMFILVLWSLGRSIQTDRRMQADFLRRSTRTQFNDIHFREVQSTEVFAVTAGFWRPRVYMSTAMLHLLSRSEQAIVLRHEATHARLRHPLAIAFLRACLAPLWWLPGRKNLITYVSARQELEADRVATRNFADAPTAARVMMKLAVVPVLAGTAWSTLESRIDQLLNPQAVIRFPRAVRFSWVAVVLFVALSFGVSALGVSAAAPHRAESVQCVDQRRICVPSPVRPPMTTLRSSYGAR